MCAQYALRSCAALKSLRGSDEEANKELEEYRAEKARSGNNSGRQSGDPEVGAGVEKRALAPAASVSFVELFRARYLMATLLAVGLQMAQQLTGINAVMFYSGSMFETASVPEHHIQYAVCVTGLINVLVTVAAVPLVDRLGRRRLLLYPMCVMGLALLGAFVTILLINVMEVKAPALPYMAIAFILLFIVGFGPGLGNLAAVLVELCC